MTDLRQRVLYTLHHEPAPGSDQDVLEAGLVRALSVEDGVVSFVLEAENAEPLADRLRTRLRAVEGVHEVSCYLASPPAEEAPAPAEGPKPLAGVRHVVLIGSGKGGVGKSTVTANLALALADLGLHVGLLDADIYGPSQPLMMGSSGRPVSYDGTLIPIAAHGVKLMSLGLMMPPEQALVWRGPILANTLAQLLHEVRWAPLDVLLIDLPPGTGDVQITLAQEALLSGAVVVTTPQGVALNDARRAVDLFERTDTPLLGMIENMSTHLCGNCGTEEPIFAPRPETKGLGLPLLGALPLDPKVCTAAEEGLPIVRSRPDSPAALRFKEIAATLWDKLEPERA